MKKIFAALAMAAVLTIGLTIGMSAEAMARQSTTTGGTHTGRPTGTMQNSGQRWGIYYPPSQGSYGQPYHNQAGYYPQHPSQGYHGQGYHGQGYHGQGYHGQGYHGQGYYRDVRICGGIPIDLRGNDTEGIYIYQENGELWIVVGNIKARLDRLFYEAPDKCGAGKEQVSE